MSRIKRLVRPDTPALNWKASLPVVGLAALCIGLAACAAPEQKPQASTPNTQASNMQVPNTPASNTRAFARFDTCRPPVWPKKDFDARHQGTVTLKFLIDANGNVKDSKLVNSSGYPGLDRAAQEGVAKCRFQPATQNGEPVEAWMQMQYVWKIER